MRSHARLWLGLTLLYACFASAASVPATGSYDPLGSGATRLLVDRHFSALLHKYGVKLLATSPAKRRGKTYLFPVTGGAVDPTAGKGEIDQEGALVFQRGERRLPLREIVVKTKRQPLIAKVGGGQLKLASAGKLHFRRDGFGSRFAAKRLSLSVKFATRLAKKLHLRNIFAAGQPFGTVNSVVEPRTVAVLPTGRASIALDPAFLAKLDSLFVSLNPISPAERAPGPIFSFPIIREGVLALDVTLGTLRTGGSLEFLQLGAGQIFWHELWFDFGAHAVLAEVDIEPTPAFPGKLGQISILDFDLATGSLSSDPQARTITVSDLRLSLNAQSAAHFNQAFAAGDETFRSGELLGTVSFSAQAQ